MNKPSLKINEDINTMSYRRDFPSLSVPMNGKSLTYLDSASSAQKPQLVINAMQNVLEQGYSNIHRGLYRISQDLTSDFESARSRIASFIGSSSVKEIVFTRNATEAVNLVAHSWGRSNLQKGDEIILTEMEHHANIVPWQLLAQEKGFSIKVIPVTPEGKLDLTNLSELLSDKTKFVGFVHVSNSLGTINPAVDIIRTVRAFNPEIKILIDGTQSVVHTKINLQALDCDFFCFTGHKLYGPSGIGVLFGKYDVLAEMQPYQGGGDMIERVSFEATTYKEPPHRFEAGTPAIVEVIGLGAAIDYMNAVDMDYVINKELELYRLAKERLCYIDGIRFFGDHDDSIGLLSFLIDDIHPSDIGMILDQCGVAVRAGHHCCMPLMQKYGIDGTIRASIGLYTNENDIIQLEEGLKKAVEMLR